MRTVVIGAGKTGRGFIGRLLFRRGVEFCFLDADETLVERLNATEGYEVSFFGGRRQGERVSGVPVFGTKSLDAAAAIAAADLVFTAVGFSNFPVLATDLSAWLRARGDAGPLIVTAENAIDPAAKLRRMIVAAGGRDLCPFVVTDAAVFCSTIEASPGALDILSEDYEELPFDQGKAEGFIGLPDFLRGDPHFDVLLSRKIFTYNCASAVVAYLGALKGYTLYGEAANDPDISAILGHTYEAIEQVLCPKFGLSREDQRAFAQASLRKFQNLEIVDSIERNARDARRKLGPEERIMGPAALMAEYGADTRWLSLTAAAAILYGQTVDRSLESSSGRAGCEMIVRDLCRLPAGSPVSDQIIDAYSKITSGVSLCDIRRSLEV